MNNLVDKIKEALGGRAKNWEERYGKRFYCEVSPGDIVEVGREMFDLHGCRLSTVSGVDVRDRIDLLYHFSVDRGGAVITLRVAIGKDDLVVDSLAPFMKSADWIEREIHEMLGVDFRGHPDLRHLLLTDDWPEGKYPLRRDNQ